jgi:transcriptional regulator of PTS gene
VVADSQPGHIDQIKQTNAGAVYRLIDQLGPVSRIDLSRFAQLALPASPKSSAKCWKRIWFRRRKSRSREPGRPAVGLMVETEAWHYLSIRISRGEIHLALRDLKQQAGGGRAAGTGVTARSALRAGCSIRLTSSLFVTKRSWSV